VTAHAENPPFERFGPATPVSPVVLAVPHAGRTYPPALIAAAAVPRSRLEGLEDRFADALIAGAVRNGATAFVARRARAWIDLNRDERELDPGMILGAALPAHAIGSARVRGGLGLIPRRLAGGIEILRRRLSATEIEARIISDYRPWHAAIADALTAAHDRFGIAILLDCHSMPPIARDKAADPARPTPRIVIGDRFGRSAGSRFVDRLASEIEAAKLPLARNSPYAGGHTLDRHGRPGKGIHAIQIEIDRSLYLALDMRTAGPGMARMTAFLAGLVQALADEALPLPSALAAE
jgi:N-formylglutamate amidohydrolase